MSFIVLQDWMLDLDLTARELMLFAIIYGFSQDGESKCYATQEYLCRWLNCTKPTLLKTIAALCERGLIEKEKIDGRGKCAYFVISKGKETLPKGKEILPLGEKKGKETLPNNINNNYNKYNNNKNMAILTSKAKETTLDDNFAAIWALYPRKEGRQRALTAYKAAIRAGVEHETIRASVERYAEKVKADSTPTQYIKQGGNWFAAHRWEDQLAADQHQTYTKRVQTNRALAYSQNHYSTDQLRALGIDLGDDIYNDGGNK